MFHQPELFDGLCYRYYDGLFGSNLMNSLKGMITILGILEEEWQQNRHDFGQVKQMLLNSRFEFIIIRFNDIIGAIYYFFTLDSSNLLIIQLKSSSTVLENSISTGYFLIAFLGFFGIFFLKKKIRVSMVEFYSVIKIMPKAVLESNVALMHHLDRVRKGKPLY